MREKTRLNEQAVRSLTPPAEGSYLQRDEDDVGFMVRVTARGKKSFVLAYCMNAHERRMNIGPWPSFSVAAARKKAHELKREIANGIDPLEEKQALREAPTVGDLATEYMQRHVPKLKSGKNLARYITRDILPEWGRRKAKDIQRRDVRALIEAKATDAPIAGCMLLGVISGMWNWAIETDIFDGPNPAYKVRRPAAKVARDRWLNEAEIRQVWERLDSAAMAPEYRAALKLILITGQRSGEVLSMERSEVSLQEATWTIPASKAKNGVQHSVPLSSMASEIIAALPQSNRWLFPSATTSNHLTVPGLSTTVARNQKHFGVPHFTPHDLRRSCATQMARAGVPQFIIGKVLNHVERGVTKIYDRHSYDLQKQEALESWSRILKRIIIGSPSAPQKVVKLAVR